jgi:hypothetical protein
MATCINNIWASGRPGGKIAIPVSKVSLPFTNYTPLYPIPTAHEFHTLRNILTTSFAAIHWEGRQERDCMIAAIQRSTFLAV